MNVKKIMLLVGALGAWGIVGDVWETLLDGHARVLLAAADAFCLLSEAEAAREADAELDENTEGLGF